MVKNIKMPRHTKTHKMTDGSMMKGAKHPTPKPSKGLTPKQKANLPIALQKAILAKRKK
jgi:hypothetical protein